MIRIAAALALAVAATKSGQAHLLVEVAAPMLGEVRSGSLKPLAVTSVQRFSGLPEVPIVAESGVTGYVTTWYALAFPARTPPAIVDKLRHAVQAVLRRGEVRKKLEDASFVAETSTPEALAAHLRSEIVRWTLVRDQAGIRPHGYI